jgi:hypothetical protein
VLLGGLGVVRVPCASNGTPESGGADGSYEADGAHETYGGRGECGFAELA